jgi:uncharacterized protein (DUF58 family)
MIPVPASPPPPGSIGSTSPTRDRQGLWHPTIAHFRATFVAVALMVFGVLARRADLLVIAAPFAVVAAWSVLRRPTAVPVLRHRLGDQSIREGDATAWHGAVSGCAEIDSVVAVLPTATWIDTNPEAGVVGAAATGDGADLAIQVRATRWGRHRVGRVGVSATSVWGSFRWSVNTRYYPLTALPLPAVFDSSAPVRRSRGLVGLNRSAYAGEGSEFAGIRPFQLGDRMRRIHWARSLREKQLHVTSTWADQDSHVMLELDATDDLGESEGIDGRASSMDLGVRAAGAIAQHFLHHGDRVSLRVFGSSPATPVPPASGQRHLRRILDTLSAIRPGSDPRALIGRNRAATSPDALVIMLSPLISPPALERALSIARRGVTVVVVDTLPDAVLQDDDPLTALAWRIRLLERRREIRIVGEAGVPVVKWRGPGSLDQFLRESVRRASAPRLARR